MLVSTDAEGPEVADSRRSGDEFHPRPPNGGLRPGAGTRSVLLECPLIS